MCVLTGPEIKRRRSEIFSRQSWSTESFQEASYDLRVDTGPVLRIGGKVYEDGVKYEGTQMKIEPGEMALLPTMESFHVPKDLVGDIKIKFSHSRKGLSPLFGPKVDPYFGKGHEDERLFLWVTNLGMSPITISRGERVFTVQFHQLLGDHPEFKYREPVGQMVAKEAYAMGPDQSLGFIDTIENRVKSELGSRLSRVEEGTGQVVLFGVFLVASALLAGAIATLFALVANPDTNSGVATVDALQESLLMDLLPWMCLAIAVAVVVLVLRVVVPFGSIGNLIRRFKWSGTR